MAICLHSNPHRSRPIFFQQQRHTDNTLHAKAFIPSQLTQRPSGKTRFSLITILT